MISKKIATILIVLIMLSIIGIVGASNSITINSTVTVVGLPPPVNETSISGFVINDFNNKGLPNWRIQLIGVTGTGINTKIITEEATTGSNGLYKFNSSEISSGRYTLILDLKFNYIPVGRTALQVNLKQNQSSENNNFRVISINDFINRIIGIPIFSNNGNNNNNIIQPIMTPEIPQIPQVSQIQPIVLPTIPLIQPIEITWNDSKISAMNNSIGNPILWNQFK